MPEIRKKSNRSNFLGNKPFKAFSLVELSIVLVVLGLLTTGAFQGSALVSKARLFSARSKTRNSPVATIPDLTFWTETTSENSFSNPQPNDGEAITLWKDINPQSSYPLDLEIYTPGFNPIYSLKGINNIPALRFSGDNNNFMQNLGVLPMQITSPAQITIFVVHFMRSGIARSFMWSVGSGSPRIYVYTPWSDGRVIFDFGDLCCNPDHRTSFQGVFSNYLNSSSIFSFLKNGSNMSIYQDSRLLVSNNAATQTISLGSVGGIYVGRGFDGNMGEIIVFSRALTDSERYSVEAYLSQKWRIKLQ